MNNIENFRKFLQENNPINGDRKTFNLSRIEKQLGVARGTISHFIAGNRTGLGENQELIIQYFRNLGYEQHLEIGKFSINKGEKVSIQDTQSGEYAEFELSLFERAIRKFFAENF